MKGALSVAAFMAATLPAFGQETCTKVMPNVTFCTDGENIANGAAMSTAFPNAVHLALDTDDWKYGASATVIPVKLSGDAARGVDAEALTNVVIRNATQKLWVDAKISDVRFREATMGAWPGVQAEFRIVGLSEGLGTNYVVDAYITNDNTVLAIQSFSDADRRITEKLRAFHKKTMANTRIAQ